ncbi:centrosome-associated zinc finger protein Cp190 [Halyomorpha halys]|uniref:centrosome-associated zinc finger protein Cp190 n=1 Tax=Halyomorpha halys TaxID=286706 RepID=UPI0006D50E96|nr:centrosome-associated zinc finger protein CP190 [Halyomorpha halys]
MASEAKTAGMKQLKVDNWGTFFMQRLQLLFAKGDSCDLTLKFVTGQELKVHSLVLRTCTSHFDSLPKVDNKISLPESLSYNAVFPIINFMYSGKLEFKLELHTQLLAVVKILNITILSKLLTTAQKTDVPVPLSVKSKPINANTEANNKTSSQLIIQQNTPTTSYNLFSSKKLPFWRKRTLPFITRFRKPIEEEPGPTRYAWPENEPMDLLQISSPSFTPLSYESDQIILGSNKDEEKDVERVIPPQRRVIESRLLTTHDSDDDDDDRFEAPYSSDEEPVPTPPPPTPLPPPPALKPCLKSSPPASEAAVTPPASKKVRFSLGPEGKENTVQSASNHARIIAEVLKKYPDLVKNKNIKLKISSPRPKIENGTVSVEEKASYVVVRPTLKSTPNTSGKQNDLVGPWTCEHCSESKFNDYLSFRRHLQETHNERLDSRVCEYCGYKSSKRNLHLYHLLTKHNVPPPKNVNFPKCPECEYIALSESLLLKHANSHQIRCDVCKISMKTVAALQAHKVTCKPGNEPRNIICDLCKKAFRTNVSLNAHLKECQGKPGNDGNIYGEDGDSQQPVEMIEVPIIGAVDVAKNDHTLVQIPSGIILAENQNVALLPSSESEGLNNVATGIAIILEGNSDFFNSNQEYIVPELLEGSFASTANISYGSTDQVIYLGSSTSNAHRGEVIHLEEIKLNQPQPGTSSAGDKVMREQKIPDTKSAINSTEQCIDITKDVLVSQDISVVSNEEINQDEPIVIEDKSDIITSVEYVPETRNVQTAVNEKVNESQRCEVEENNNSSQNLISDISTEKNDSVPLNVIEQTNAEVLHVQNSEHKLSVNSELEEDSRIITEEQPQQSEENVVERISLIEESNDEEKREEQISSSSEKMQVDEAREEMIVDENKDEDMDVEENLDLRSTKDAMDVEEAEKTGNEKVDSLVKDWGFDDEDNEEVIDDPDCKPLRPEIDIPL